MKKRTFWIEKIGKAWKRHSVIWLSGRTTIANYLSVLEATYVAHIVRPFSSMKAAEIVSAPKVYGFDTGFICY